ncbi:MAG TPA: agmatine deiminase family protein, partial [Tepidisphaeraceae bacterium]
FMMLIGQQTALVGDPSLVKPLITPAVATALLDDPDYSAATQAKFDAVARQLEREGYSVVRIPTVASTDGKTYLTYLNGLIDCRDGRRAVYLPVYRGADAVNAAAADVWRAMGFDVHPIDCTDVYRNFGTLHCLVNVLDRSAEK